MSSTTREYSSTSGTCKPSLVNSAVYYSSDPRCFNVNKLTLACTWSNFGLYILAKAVFNSRQLLKDSPDSRTAINHRRVFPVRKLAAKSTSFSGSVRDSAFKANSRLNTHSLNVLASPANSRGSFTYCRLFRSCLVLMTPFPTDCCGDDADFIATTVFSTSSSSFKTRHRKQKKPRPALFRTRMPTSITILVATSVTVLVQNWLFKQATRIYKPVGSRGS